MNYEQFDKILADLGMTKREFAAMVGMNERAVTNWSTAEQVARWVPSWLENYKKAKTIDDLKEFIRKSGLCA